MEVTDASGKECVWFGSMAHTFDISLFLCKFDVASILADNGQEADRQIITWLRDKPPHALIFISMQIQCTLQIRLPSYKNSSGQTTGLLCGVMSLKGDILKT